jgi:hypothetical protein
MNILKKSPKHILKVNFPNNIEIDSIYLKTFIETKDQCFLTLDQYKSFQNENHAKNFWEEISKIYESKKDIQFIEYDESITSPVDVSPVDVEITIEDFEENLV